VFTPGRTGESLFQSSPVDPNLAAARAKIYAGHRLLPASGSVEPAMLVGLRSRVLFLRGNISSSRSRRKRNLAFSGNRRLDARSLLRRRRLSARWRFLRRGGGLYRRGFLRRRLGSLRLRGFRRFRRCVVFF
jgi:hypothetical protein